MKCPNRPGIFDLSKKEIEQQLSVWGEPAFRARQVWEGLYRHLWNAPSQYTNLPTPLREKLEGQYDFKTLHVEREIQSKDLQTEKFLFRLGDGNYIESVLMLYEKRQSICISTQSGCGMGCIFCASGQMGLKRNLTTGEIVEQTHWLARKLQSSSKEVTNIVYMGMGEPFQNFANVMKSIEIICDPDGMNFSERRITISTVGLIPFINKFASMKQQINLAISLHAPDNELRNELVPINKTNNIEGLIQACKSYIKETGRRITFEYALIKGVNDDPAQARSLSSLLRGMICHVNLIRLNPSQYFDGLPSSHQKSIQFKKILQDSGIPCTIRLRRGVEINAGCGQLAYDKSSTDKN